MCNVSKHKVTKIKPITSNQNSEVGMKRMFLQLDQFPKSQ